MSEQTSDKTRAVGQAQTDADKFSERDVKFMRAALDALKDCPDCEVPVAAVVVCGQRPDCARRGRGDTRGG